MSDQTIQNSSTPPDETESNFYLKGALSVVFLKTAAPIIIIMAVNGLFTLVDAYFLGVYVSSQALAAVTLTFPIYMLLIALSTLVSIGFSSIYARLLGAKEMAEAKDVFGQAIALSLIVSLFLMLIFYIFGQDVMLLLSDGSEILSDFGYEYIAILMFCSPLMFVLSVNIDALRSEGALTAMAAVSLASALLNIMFDYVFIAEFKWGVAGSAYGTLAAQACAFCAIILYRLKSGKSDYIFILSKNISHYWRLLALGAPASLGYLGIALSSTLTLFTLQIWIDGSYEATAGAYGILTRLMTFAFLPLIGISVAFQSITGNNYGAKVFERSNLALKYAIVIALIYGVLIEITFLLFRHELGALFVDDENIISELARILPYSVALMFVFAPQMMVGAYFQAIGDASRAGLLSLARTYIFGLPLIFLAPFIFGEPGIWIASVIAEICVTLLTVLVLWHHAKTNGKIWGLFEPPILVNQSA